MAFLIFTRSKYDGLTWHNFQRRWQNGVKTFRQHYEDMSVRLIVCQSVFPSVLVQGNDDSPFRFEYLLRTFINIIIIRLVDRQWAWPA